MRKESGEHQSEFREFVKELDQPVFDFFYYMLGGASFLDDMVLRAFRRFGEHYRRALKKRIWQPLDMRIELFQTAWEEIRSAEKYSVHLGPAGRDTRKLKDFDSDLLARWKKSEKLSDESGNLLEKRLLQVDLDYRAPLILKDILDLEDEQVMRVLSLRWGVYRHRLHRGRVALAVLLKGSNAPSSEIWTLSQAKGAV